jgi:syntaxin-binding protein 1
VSLGEYPKIRYYKPPQPVHEASVLCSHLARFVQEELDAYAKWNPNFPPQSTRPQGMLIITDRSMDLVAPLIHEFTYQAMAHDLLPIKEGDKVLYKTIINEGTTEENVKDMEIGEKDEIWVKNRHMHMKDTIERLMGDFQKFIDENPHFTSKSGDATSLNAIKDMLAGLPQFQELKEAYSLHLSMAQECMNIFQHRKLPDIASVEQSLATRLDEDYKKPRNLADQVIRLLDDESVSSSDRLRLIMLFIIYRDGVIPQDIQRLLAHAGLPSQDGEIITNLDLLGGRSMKALKDKRPIPAPLFPGKTAPTAANEEYALSRFEPALKLLLEELKRGTLDPNTFPYTKPPLDNTEAAMYNNSQASLRSAKPTWAQNRRSMHESKQRVIVFMAGGATYSESRACYEISRTSDKDVFLATSHMLTPAMFLRQVGDLGVDKRRLDLPSERPKPRAPAHIFEREEKKVTTGLPPGPTAGPGVARPGAAPAPLSQRPVAGGYLPPTAGMANMTINSSGGRPSNGSTISSSQDYSRTGKLEKKLKDGDEKKKKGFFSSKK